VAKELLAQAEIQVTIANDGKEGVDILTARPEAFDGVLMDIQMPILDGYAATREIRKHRQFKALPIIAMTANAMVKDRDEALASGMNDHVAKPIEVAQLFDVLSRWVQLPHERRSCDSRNADASEITTNEASSLPVLPGVDTRAGLARVGGRVSVYRKILQQFVHSQTDAPERVRRALQGHEPNTARREAHTLKGVAGNIGANEVAAVAARLETAIQAGADTEGPIVELERILGTLRASVTTITAIPTAIEPTNPIVSGSDLLPVLDRLQVLLEESDCDAGELVTELLSGAAQTEFARSIREIEACIDDFEHEKALEHLNALKEAISDSKTGATTLP
jgi:CheY-like chemotaxis protein